MERGHNNEGDAATIRILLVEDSAISARLLFGFLKKGLPNHEVHHATTLSDGMAFLDSRVFDIVLLDLNLQDSAGLDTFISVNAHPAKTPIVVLSGDGNEQLAVEAVRLGAQDYLVKSQFDHNHLSRSIRFAIERSQRIHFEDEVVGARVIQQKLYPSKSPKVPGFNIAGLAFPAAQVSGDYFDYLPMSDGQLGIVVGDVSGHGVGPALLMAETRAYLHALTYDARSGRPSESGDLAQVLFRANNLLMATCDSLFVTLFFLCLDPQTNSYTYAAAGHRILHLTHEKTILKRDSTGPALGFTHDAEFNVAGPFPISEGDVLFIGTDGFEESQVNGELFGIDRVAEALWQKAGCGAEAMLRNAHRLATEFTGNIPQADDMTAVVVTLQES